MIITIENPLLKLKGSPVRDTFKHLHKVMGETYHYATDCDFVIVRKYPRPEIVAFMDCKRPQERLTFTQVIFCNEIRFRSPWETLIVEFDTRGDLDAAEHHRLRVWLYLWGDPYPNPPQYRLSPLTDWLAWREYLQWEHDLRSGHKTLQQYFKQQEATR